MSIGHRMFQIRMPRLGAVEMIMVDCLVDGDNRIYLVAADPSGKKHVFAVPYNGLKFAPPAEAARVLQIHAEEVQEWQQMELWDHAN